MARGVNKVILIGNLGKDPEVRSFANGGSVCNATLATSESWKDREGNPQERTEWHNVVFNDKLAEIAGKFLRKGSKVYVEGSLRTRKWQDKTGQDRYTTEIRVNDMQMLDGRPGGGGDASYGSGGGRQSGGYDRGGADAGWGGAAASSGAAASPAMTDSFDDDDIPF